jgi:hypothetical protein
MTLEISSAELNRQQRRVESGGRFQILDFNHSISGIPHQRAPTLRASRFQNRPTLFQIR